MKIIPNILTNNNCYKKGQKITIKGIMIHSTACKGVPAVNFLKSWNVEKPNGKSVCVHAFIDNIGIYQTLPFDFQAWHCGGNGNNLLIGFEVCEPKEYADKEYFKNVKNKAKQLCVYLCKKYNLTAESITTHCEAYAKKGKAYASNHSDIDHWWKKHHNYTIDDFRKEIENELKKGNKQMTGKEALEYLVANGRITDKAYWEKALETTRNIEYLFIKWVEDIK